MKKILFLVFFVVLLVGCESDSRTVNYVQAKEKIINEGAVLVDVRTKEEYDENHIDGALLLPLDTISESTASDVIDNKNSVVIVYCKSGKRSAQAMESLVELGYTNVYDLGAMANWNE